MVHPSLYLNEQIGLPIRSNNMKAKVVRTFLISRQYERDLGASTVPAAKKTRKGYMPGDSGTHITMRGMT